MKQNEFLEWLNENVLDNSITLMMDDGTREQMYKLFDGYHYNLYSESNQTNLADDMKEYDSLEELKGSVERNEKHIVYVEISNYGMQDRMDADDLVCAY